MRDRDLVWPSSRISPVLELDLILPHSQLPHPHIVFAYIPLLEGGRRGSLLDASCRSFKVPRLKAKGGRVRFVSLTQVSQGNTLVLSTDVAWIDKSLKSLP